MKIPENINKYNIGDISKTIEKINVKSENIPITLKKELIRLEIKLETIDLLNKFKNETILKGTITKLNKIIDKIQYENNYNDFDFKSISSFKNKEKLLSILLSISGTKDGALIFLYIKEMKKAGLANTEISLILKESASTIYGTGAFLHIEEMKEIGLNNEQITIILKETSKSNYWEELYIDLNNLANLIPNKEYIKIILASISKTPYGTTFLYNIATLKNGIGLNNTQITFILKNIAGTKKSMIIFDFIESMKIDGGLSPEQITIILKESVKNQQLNKKFDIINKIIKDNESIKNLGGLNNYMIADILTSCLGKGFKGFKQSFLQNYSYKNILNKKYISLGNNFKKYEKDFQDKKSFNKFLEIILIQGSINVTKSMIYIYDYYEEINDKKKKYNIEKEILRKMSKYSIEELLSALGNHTFDYSIIFRSIVSELNKRISGNNYVKLIEYINNNNNLTEKTKIFLKGQIIIGLSAKGRIKKLEQISTINDFFIIIDSIINYKNNNIFNFESYAGLIIGFRNLILKNNNLAIKLFNRYNNKAKYINFMKALNISLSIVNKKITKKGIVSLNNEEKESYKDIKKMFLLPHEYIFKQNPKDIVISYGGNSKGGGDERYNNELNYYKNKFNYKKIKSGKGYSIIEKDGIRLTFIKYDFIEGDVNSILKKNNIKPLFFTFRGHNYKTSLMIKNMKKLLNNNPNTIIIDGGCKNISMKGEYIEYGISNQLAAFSDTGKGWATFNYIRYIISGYLRHPEIYADKEITLEQLTNNILNEDHYILNNMKFPGDLYDIVLKIKNGEL